MTDPLIERISLAWLHYQGYTDAELEAAPNQHRSYDCELNGYEWQCHDEYGNSLHPVWDAVMAASEMACVIAESLGLTEENVRDVLAEKLTDKKGKVRHNAACDVLAARWPNVPNHGDLTTVDWGAVEPVDILTGGYPCQPFSAAGQRKGEDDERHIWPDIRQAIRRLRPQISLRAADVGAAHGRERLWIIVTPDAKSDGWQRLDGGAGGSAACGGRPWQSPRRVRRTSVPNAKGNGRDEGWTEPEGLFGRPDAPVGGVEDLDLLPTPRATRGGSSTETVHLLPTPTARDYKGGNTSVSDGNGGRRPVDLADTTRSRGDGGASTLPDVAQLLPTPTASDGTGGGSHPSRRVGHTQQLIDEVLGVEAWGKYGPAIGRWEAITRPAPSPTEPNRNGKPRLNPAFSEWMMGWPAGWVTQWLLNLEACGVVA